jgi:tRNA pseudouridine55 synthase
MLEVGRLQTINEKFTGNINQIPPTFSAVKVDGKRSYQYARDGKAVPLKPKKVIIYRIETLDLVGNLLTLRICCSRGTYIRSLARDYSATLNTVGFLRSLKRTRIGQYNLTSSLDITQSIKLLEQNRKKF